MAVDAYLQIDGVKGESTDDKHRDRIELAAASWGHKQAHNDRAGSAGGHTVGAADFDHFLFSKAADLASPILMQLCASGKTIPKAKVEFMRADGNGQRVKYYEIEFENLIICDASQSLPGAGVVHDQYALQFSKIKWTYTQQKKSGGKAGSTSGGWNLASRRSAT